LRIVMDDREPEGIEKLLRRNGMLVERKRIEVADYLIGTDVCVERKTLEDFLRSIYDGRLFDQVEEMFRCCSRILLLIEGSYRLDGRGRFHYLGALARLSLEGVSVIHVNDYEDTAYLLTYLAKKVEGDKPSIIPVRKRRKVRGFEEAYSVLLSFPSIGPKSAEKLMSEFKNLKEIFNADFPKLKSLIGEAKARKFREVLNTPFTRERETKLEDQG
jgi:DNA excision repair protein ERCC-4